MTEDSSRESILSVSGLRKSYATGSEGELVVLDDLALDVARGEILAVVGESGTGKSTLLHLLGALDRPDRGEVLYEGRNLAAMGDDELAAFRNRAVGFVFQFHHLLPEFTAVENVAMPALIHGRSLGESRPRAMELLELLGVGDRASHRPSELSGGEQQRVAVARALMNAPALVLADEPTGNLDTDTADRLFDEIVRLSRTLGQTFVVATHNQALAARADRVVRLRNHRLEPTAESGTE
jgi:lipoprotein-releasing system ATP-binding protein